MIKLSDLLDAMGDGTRPEMLMIREAKRLEALDVPRNEAERKPLVDEDGYKVYIIVDERGCCADWHFTGRDADLDARNRTEDTGQPHTVCQVMAPESGECPTVPVATYTHTPERPHEWVIYRVKCEYDCHWFAITARGDKCWGSSPAHRECQRFATATEAQTYIDTHKIEGAYPWPVPKLTTAS